MNSTKVRAPKTQDPNNETVRFIFDKVRKEFGDAINQRLISDRMVEMLIKAVAFDVIAAQVTPNPGTDLAKSVDRALGEIGIG